MDARRFTEAKGVLPPSFSDPEVLAEVDRLSYWVPTPAEIDERATAIRKKWSNDRLRKRSGRAAAELAFLPVALCWPQRKGLLES